jgi:hypothetical protein
VRAWEYGLLGPLEWPEWAETEIRLQNDLWNKLVEVERGHRAAVDAVMGRDPAVAAAAREASEIQARLDELFAERQRRSQAARKRVESPDLDAAAATAKARLREVWPQLKAARKEAGTRFREDLAALSEARYRAVVAARQSSGLWWGNYNAVCADFDTACRRSYADGTALNFHRWDGAGRLTNQFQGGLDVADLSGNSQVRIGDLPPGHPLLARGAGRKGALRALEWTVRTEGRGGERRTVTFPMVMHREFPPGRVKTATVVRRRTLDGPGRTGGTYRWTVVFAVDEPERTLAHPHDNAACGVNLGWRRVPGGIRVATVVDDAGGCEHVVVPDKWLGLKKGLKDRQGSVDEARNALVDRLLLVPGAPPEQLAALWRRLRDAPSSALVARLAEAWARECPGWEPEQLEAASRWRRADRLRRASLANRSDMLVRDRRELFRRAAKSLAGRFGSIAISQADFSALARDEELPQEARAWGAPSALRAEIRRAAERTGARVHDVAGPVTPPCHVCKATAVPANRLDLVWTCPNGHTWDQDYNAAANTRDTAGRAGAAPRRNRVKGARITRRRDASAPAAPQARDPLE